MAESSIQQLTKYLLRKLKSFLLSKDVLSFLVFLLLSMAFWFVNALENKRELRLEVPIVYTGIPNHVTLFDPLPAYVTIQLSDQGKNLWKYITNPPSAISLEIQTPFKESGLLTISNAQLVAAVSERIYPTTTLLQVTPESMVSKYAALHSRTVPVKLNLNVTTADQFKLCRPPDFLPKTVEVFGPKSVIDTLSFVPTKVLVIDNLNDIRNVSVALAPKQDIRYQVSTVTVNLCAEMFTEKSVELPVHVINSPDNIVVRTFPSTVKVTFNIRVSQYAMFNNDDILVVIDYEQMTERAGGKKKLKLINHKDYISNIRIQPEEVEYVFERKREINNTQRSTPN